MRRDVYPIEIALPDGKRAQYVPESRPARYTEVVVNIPQHLLAHIDRSGDCWLWTGRLNDSGYGMAGQRRVHRWMYELVYGPIPEGLCVCHHCDVRNCVRPDHLFLGTRGDNNRDMTAKGRHGYGGVPGEKNHKAKLTDAQVEVIRAQYAPGRVRQQDLADELGVSRALIGHIIRGRNRKRHAA